LKGSILSLQSWSEASDEKLSLFINNFIHLPVTSFFYGQIKDIKAKKAEEEDIPLMDHFNS
jgi:hypothetical protein